MAARRKRLSGQPRKLTARQKAKIQRDMGRRLAEARREAGRTQRGAAQALGLTASVVSKIERGERRLDPLELARFARLYGKTLVDFVR